MEYYDKNVILLFIVYWSVDAKSGVKFKKQ